MVPPGAHVAPVLFSALEALWARLPAVLDRHGQSRFDFLIRQHTDGIEEPADLLWQSGMNAGTLFSVVARKLLKAQAAASQVHPGAHVQGEVTELHGRQADRVLNTLAQLTPGRTADGSFEWEGVR